MPKPQVYHLPQQIVALYIAGQHVTTGYKKTLATRWAEGGTHSINEYLSKKYKWASGTVDRIDWGAIPANKMGTGKRTFIVSYCHQWLPLDKKLHERNTIGSPLCPMCDAEHEDHQHFLTCSHYEGLTTRQVLGQIDSHTKAKGVDRILRLILQ